MQIYLKGDQGGAFAARCVAQLEKDVIMTFGPLGASAIAFGAAAFALFSPLAPAQAATVTHRYAHAAHSRVAHGVHGYVAHSRVGHRHYVWRNGHRYGYGYGYNPGAAVAAGVIAGAAAGYPAYCGDYAYGAYGGPCDDYGWGYGYPDYGYGYGWGGPGFVGRGHFHQGFGNGFAFHGGGAHFASGNFGHMGGFGGGHMGGFGGGHMGGFGGHMGGGGHFR
jgi:hypothetical protein